MQILWQKIVDNDIPKKSGCDNCRDGFIRVPKTPIGWDVKRCGCSIERESLKVSRKLFEYSNIGKRFLEKYRATEWHESDFLNFDILDKIISPNRTSKNWLFITGSTGSGKTYAAIMACQIALLKEMSVYFITVTELLDSMRPTEHEGTKPELVMELCKRVSVLVLDDIGHEKSSDWVREKLYSIINYRWSNGKITVFTSNYDIENLKTTVSPAVYSRVKGDSLEIKLISNIDKRIHT